MAFMTFIHINELGVKDTLQLIGSINNAPAWSIHELNSLLQFQS